MNTTEILQSDEYKQYHQQVVNACVVLTGEHNRVFWDKECDYLEAFTEKRDPAEEAQNQVDSL